MFVPCVSPAKYFSFKLFSQSRVSLSFRVFFRSKYITEMIMCVLPLPLTPSYILPCRVSLSFYTRRIKGYFLLQCSLFRIIQPFRVIFSPIYFKFLLQSIISQVYFSLYHISLHNISPVNITFYLQIIFPLEYFSPQQIISSSKYVPLQKIIPYQNQSISTL